MSATERAMEMKDDAVVGPYMRRKVTAQNRNAGPAVKNDDPKYFEAPDRIAGTGPGSVSKDRGEPVI